MALSVVTYIYRLLTKHHIFHRLLLYPFASLNVYMCVNTNDIDLFSGICVLVQSRFEMKAKMFKFDRICF